MNKTLNVVFAGTPDFSVPALSALHQWCLANGHALTGVLTQPDRPAGRGRKLRKSPVKLYAEKHNIAVDQPITLRSPEGRKQLDLWQPDLMVVVAYGLLLPEEVLQLPRFGCINVHASLLPRWRGAAPIQRAIEAGDTETGVSIMQMDIGLDTGPVWSFFRVPVTAEETGGSLHDKLAETGAQALIETLPEILAGLTEPEAQTEVGVTYANKLTKKEGRIDWSESSESILRKIRAFDPWPVAHSTLDERGIRVFSAVSASQCNTADNTAPGTIVNVDEGLFVMCGDGAIEILSLQPSGSRRMPASAFLHAHSCLHQVLS